MITLKDRLVALIAQNGPMTVAQFMTSALYDPMSGYYARRAQLGADGDFITAPEISQMFGELVGLWCAQAWLDMGAPPRLELIELGPGTGRMMSDIWRAAKAAPGFRDAIEITLVETSAPLREQQRAMLGDAPVSWMTRFEDASEGPAIVVANEFLDCMPIRQFVRVKDGWRERLVGVKGDDLVFGLASGRADESLIPRSLRDAREGTIAETAPALAPFVAEIAARFAEHPGRALFIDYGAARTAGGDTLQALQAHTKVDPLQTPGAADLTAHVDFEALGAHARAHALDVAGPVGQGAFLKSLGMEARAQVLARARPDMAAQIARQEARLVDENAMGVLFQAIALSSPGLPSPPGFA